LSKKNIEKLLQVLENQYNKKPNFDTILVTGSSGKTTTSHYTNLIIQNCLPHLSIGLFSKPHIKNITERIRINYQPISQEEFLKYEYFINQINQKYQINLNWFDKLVAIAITYFIDKQVNLAIFEIGIGGLNDSTNALNSIINIITHISLEHTDILGKTIKSIAIQKAGIIKQKSIVITNATKGIKIIQQKCQETQSKLIHLKDKIKLKLIKSQILQNKFIYKYKIKIENQEYILQFPTYYLVNNFLLSFLASTEYINKLKKVKFSNTSLQEIIDKLQIPLKLQIIKFQNKTIIIDSCKDYQSLIKLFKEIKKKISTFSTILAFSKGKEPRLIKKLLLFLEKNKIKAFLTEHSINEKKLNPTQLISEVKKLSNKKEIQKINNNTKVIDQIKTIEDLKKIINDIEDETIVITGSLYFCSEIYSSLFKTCCKLYQKIM